MARVRIATGGDTEIYPASHRYARISARKARLVMDTIRGDRVESALNKLRFSPRRGAPMIRKVVESAVANALQKSGTEAEDLVVFRAFVDEGPTMKRWRPRSMGRAYPRLKRSCHLTVVLKTEPAAEKKRPARGKTPVAAEASKGEGQED